MTNAFTVSGLTKTYPDFVLDQVSFSVPSGSIVGLIGENGARSEEHTSELQSPY